MLYSILETIEDKEYILAYNNSSNYTELANKLGYSQNINANIRKNLKNRATELGLKEYNFKPLIISKKKCELFSSRSSWQNARSAIQKHARTVFFNSDIPKECLKCGYNKHIEVAHIKSVSSFSDDTYISKINEISNLIALCPNHHWEYDNNLLKLY